MRTSCASALLLACRPGCLPELLDEGDRLALLDVVVYDGFGNAVSQPDLLGRFAYTGLEELAGEGLHAAAVRCYYPGLGRWLESDPIDFGPKKGSGTVEISHNSPTAGGVEL